jgi:carboxyl-terminal processing protease
MKCTFLALFLFFGSIFSTSAQDERELFGFWQMEGYGIIAHISEDIVKMYDTTEISCTPSREYPTTMLSSNYSFKGTELTLGVGVTQFVLNKIEQLPAICDQKLSKKKNKDPIFNFEVLWRTFDEHYLYFEERNVDWAASYKKYRARINENTTAAELYAVCYEMVEDLNEGHSSIDADDKTLSKASKIFPEITEEDTSLKPAFKKVAKTYLKNRKAHNLTKIIWGNISPEIGYVQVNDMSTQADYGITPKMSTKEAIKKYVKALRASEDRITDEVNGIHNAMVQIMDDFKDTDAIILDVRFNDGGYDAVAFEILRFFAAEPFVAFKKYARKENGKTQPYFYEVTPIEGYGTKKLYILQSHFSASAVETMLLASLQMPNVIRIGSPSNGIFSDALEKVLPIGWEFTLSNEAYMTPDGINYEAQGIPPDITFEYPKEAAAFVKYFLDLSDNKGDAAIEYILETERN